MKYYAVIDTNVVVSAFLKKGSIPDQVITYVMDGPITPLFNEEVLGEYKEVLLRNKFGISEQRVNRFINDVIKKGILIERTPSDEVIPDKDDIVFYEITLTAKELGESYLVTGNLKHFPNKKFIVTPREMLDIIEKTLN